MATSSAKTVEAYLKELPEDRRTAIEAVRKVILKHLPKGYEEGISYGMIGYYIPLSKYPKGYLDNKDQPLVYAGLASQKNYMAVYLMGIYGHKGEESWFQKEYKASGKKLDMGKSCVRFRKLDDLPLEVIGKAIAMTTVDEYIKKYEESRKRK